MPWSPSTSQADLADWLYMQAVPLADMMLGCLGHSEQSVADAALEYISCLDYVPMTDRSPQLQVTLLIPVYCLEVYDAMAPVDGNANTPCI